MKPILESLQEFIDSPKRNDWLYSDNIKVYVRKSHRTYDKEMVKCLDIANVTVKDRGRGEFTRMMTGLVEKFNCNIFVESIMSPAVTHVCKKLGFEPHKGFYDNMILIRETNKK